MKAIASGQLSLEHEEKEKELLSIGEALGLRGPQIDKLHAQATSEMSKKATAGALEGLKDMSLTVVDGDFPRDVLASKNLAIRRVPDARPPQQCEDLRRENQTRHRQETRRAVAGRGRLVAFGTGTKGHRE